VIRVRKLTFRRDILARAVAESAAGLREAARELLGKPGTDGPSRPGEAPRMDSGRLRDSIFARVGADGFSAEVGTDLDYGAQLEFGTQRMAPRPWLHPAFEASKSRIKARLRKAARDALRGGRS
jgi:phage gpG-like protein